MRLGLVLLYGLQALVVLDAEAVPQRLKPYYKHGTSDILRLAQAVLMIETAAREVNILRNG